MKTFQFYKFIVEGKRSEIPTTAPAFFAGLIDRCWAKNPDEKPSANEIVEYFEHDNVFKVYN